MRISRLRLLGFKSVRRTHRAHHRARPDRRRRPQRLRQVRTCSKRSAGSWARPRTSSMRAAAMDDVIFSGTNARPARNVAEVTIFLDNSERRAPVGVQRSRRDRDHPPHRARGGIGLPHQRRAKRVPATSRSCSRTRRPAPALLPSCARVRSRDRQRQARTTPPRAGGCRRHCRLAQPPPRGRASPQGRERTIWRRLQRHRSASSHRRWKA